MSRLYYSPDWLSRGTAGSIPRRHASFKVDNVTPKEYGEKVAKLIPGEIIAGYVCLVGLIPLIKFESVRPLAFAANFVLCLVLTPIYLNVQAERGRPKRNHLILSTVAFPVWAYAVSGGVVIPHLYDSAIASILLVLFTLVSGVIPLDE